MHLVPFPQEAARRSLPSRGWSSSRPIQKKGSRPHHPHPSSVFPAQPHQSVLTLSVCVNPSTLLEGKRPQEPGGPWPFPSAWNLRLEGHFGIVRVSQLFNGLYVPPFFSLPQPLTPPQSFPETISKSGVFILEIRLLALPRPPSLPLTRSAQSEPPPGPLTQAFWAGQCRGDPGRCSLEPAPASIHLPGSRSSAGSGEPPRGCSGLGPPSGGGGSRGGA